MSQVFADRVQVTTDRLDWRALRDLLLPVLDAAGAAPVIDDPASESGLWESSNGGKLKVQRYGQAVAIGASGRMLVQLRAAGMFLEYLASLGSFAHKVTHLDATMDVPVDAAKPLRAMYRRATAGKVSLSRKAVAPRNVTRLMSPRLDGVESGTVYVGGRHADVRLCMYDKQHERQSRGDLGAEPCLRYELRLKGGLVTLRDVAEPAPVFWHHMGRVLPCPPSVPAWEPSDGSWVPERAVVDLQARLRARVTSSLDLAALVRLSRSEGLGGLDELFREIRWAFPPPRESAELA